jgi:hypothetical protein
MVHSELTTKLSLLATLASSAGFNDAKKKLAAGPSFVGRVGKSRLATPPRKRTIVASVPGSSSCNFWSAPT